jgi:hypothetical protein
LVAFIVFEEETAVEGTLAGVPDRLVGGFAFNTVEGLVVGYAVRDGALNSTDSGFNQGISVIAGKAVAIILWTVTASCAILIAGEGSLQADEYNYRGEEQHPLRRCLFYRNYNDFKNKISDLAR